MQTETGGTYTEMANGMHYLDVNGNWSESREEIEVINGLGVAQYGQHQVVFSASASDVPAIDMHLPSGDRLQSRVAGIAYLDGGSGQSAWLAQIQNSVGQVHAPNVVIYPLAFGDDLHADIRCTYTKYGFEQDIVLREQLVDPASLNPPLDPNTTLVQVWTEFFNPPAPEKNELLVFQQNDPVQRQKMAVPDLIDECLDFGTMQVGQGMAFSLGDDGQNPMDPQSGVRVCKAWVDEPDTARHFLVESVPYVWLAPLLQGLPPKQAAVGKRKQDEMWAKVQPNRRALMASLPKTAGKKKGTEKLQMASLKRAGKGVVLDYTTINANKTNYTFLGDTTYYISGSVTLKGSGSGSTNTTTFEAGTVLKMSPTNTAKLTIQNQITWLGTSYRPVVITARDDTTVGETVTSNTITNFDTALYVDAATAGTNAVLQNLRIAYATNAIVLNGNTGHSISHAQFVNCQNGIKPVSTIFSLRNALFHKVLNDFNAGSASSSTGNVEHITVDTASWLNYSNWLTLNLTNSLLVLVTNTVTLNGSNSVSSSSATSGIFTSVGSGYHYLADNTYRNAGTTGINGSLATALTRLTTYPPITLTTDFATPTTLSPQAGRDTDTPDLGYHYDPLDYCWTSLNLSNTTLTLTNGVAIGVYGTNGVRLQTGAKFVSQGKPDILNRIVRYNAVQEQSVAWGNTGSTIGLFDQTNNPGTLPTFWMRFTDAAFLADSSARRYLVNNGANAFVESAFTVMDSQLRGNYILVYPGASATTTGLTNNLIQQPDFHWEQGSSGAQQQMTLNLRNNLFKGGKVALVYNTNFTTWTVKDNLFDSVSLTTGGTKTFVNGNNGYYNTTVLAGTLGADVTLTAVDYQTGPLGGYYYPTNGVSGGLTNLINKGSQAANLAGLYHYTTSIGLTKETNSTVEIGYHYVATDANGNPIDTDGDGVPDYLEDINGNGSVDSGETDWQSAGDGGLRVRITEPKSNSNVP